MQDFEVTKLNPYFVNNQRTLSVNKKDESDCPTLAVTQLFMKAVSFLSHTYSL